MAVAAAPLVTSGSPSWAPEATTLPSLDGARCVRHELPSASEERRPFSRNATMLSLSPPLVPAMLSTVDADAAAASNALRNLWSSPRCARVTAALSAESPFFSTARRCMCNASEERREASRMVFARSTAVKRQRPIAEASSRQRRRGTAEAAAALLRRRSWYSCQVRQRRRQSRCLVRVIAPAAAASLGIPRGRSIA
eukprot:scaffold191869_cov29-Tisochrysis_lutea.AAC.3